MAEVGTLRLDIAKLVFQVLGVDVAGPVVIRTVASRWWILSRSAAPDRPGLKRDCFCSAVKQPATTTDCLPRPKVCARQR